MKTLTKTLLASLAVWTLACGAGWASSYESLKARVSLPSGTEWGGFEAPAVEGAPVEGAPAEALAIRSGGGDTVASGREDFIRAALEAARAGRSFSIEPEQAAQGGEPVSVSAVNTKGDISFLHGNLEADWTKKEWDRFYDVARALAKRSYRIIMNPVATVEDVRNTVQDERTLIIIWSSHGNSAGQVRDTNKELLPQDAWSAKIGRRFRRLVLGSCFGDQSVKYYDVKDLDVKYWKGTTTTDDLFDYLNSKDFDPAKLPGPRSQSQ